jgi:hypothetical protein
MTITCEELYDQVWSRPMTAVATEQGISATYLARVCGYLRVPHPPCGYWAKVTTGYQQRSDPLYPSLY